MGNPLLDLLVECKDAELHKKYDLKEDNAILADEKHRPLYDELVAKYKVEHIAGGATQNVLRGAQHGLPPRSTVYIGCVGDDEFAAIQKGAAEVDGLRVEYLVDKEHPTGTCAVLCYNEQRYGIASRLRTSRFMRRRKASHCLQTEANLNTRLSPTASGSSATAGSSLVTNLSAAEHYSISHLESPEVWSLVEGARYYYISGFFLTVSPPSIVKVAEHAAAADK
ncbi:MAG: Ribokinase-like protein, partial [Olpidium bornovanus]